MRNLLTTCLTLGLLLSAVPQALANTSEAFTRVITDADNVRREAREVRELLRGRDGDLSQVQARIGVLESHAQALKAAMDALDPSTLGTAQQAALTRARNATDAMLALLVNKTTLLNDPVQAQKQRSLLRAKAEGIAKRAEIVGQQMARLRG